MNYNEYKDKQDAIQRKCDEIYDELDKLETMLYEEFDYDAENAREEYRKYNNRRRELKRELSRLTTESRQLSNDQMDSILTEFEKLLKKD